MKLLAAPKTKSSFGCCLCLTLVWSSLFNGLFLGTMAQQPERPALPTQPKRAKPAATSFRKLPLSFEANRGQTDRQVEFLSRGPGCRLFLTSTEAVLVLTQERVDAITRREDIANSKANSNNPRSPVVQMKFVGANPKPEVNGLEQLSPKNNYFIGSDPRQWRTGIPTYAKVSYSSLYPGIDLIYYGDQGQLEYDLVVAPAGDPGTITLAFQGADKIEVNPAGNLVLHINGGQILQRRPLAYQTVNGAHKPVEGKYAIKGINQIGFEVGAYDRSKPLVIDPVLVYSTYLSGSGADEGIGIAVDSAKNSYITGVTSSLNFPTTAGALQTAQGNNDVFITKLNAAGTAVLYSTYIGGSDNDEGTSIQVDAAGNAYVTGSTDSPNFPTTTGAFQTSPHGGSDAFVAKLNPTGSGLVYSTYLGGSNDDEAYGLATDLSGNAYVTGVTNSSNFPTTTSAYQTIAGGGGDAFVARLNPTGTALDYSTYLGGNGVDWGFGIATDLGGNAYVTGTTYSPNFPVTASAYQNSYGGKGDAFVAKLNSAGSTLSYSSYLGGSSIDSGFGISYGLGGVVYLAGITDSPNFPTSLGALQSVRGGGSDAFVTKLDTSLAGPTSLIYSTYLGGSGVDWGFGLTTDLAGNAYVSGTTYSSDFPISPNANQSTNAGGSDAFVANINSAGTSVVYATYFGGGNNDAGLGHALDSAGSAYVTGITDSIDFPITPGAFQTARSGGSEAFVTKLDVPVTPTPTPQPTPSSAVQFSAANYSVGEGDGYVHITVTRSGDTSGAAAVDYHTMDTDTFTFSCRDVVNNQGSAYARCDFATVVGTFSFAAGETVKNFDVSIIDDSYHEVNETFSVVLSNPTGATLGTPSTATVTIVDNDAVNGQNPILQTDNAGVAFFVRQHYLDFLGREPEPGEPWSAILRGCADQFNVDPNSPSAGCDRITVSGAFFGSPEFKDKGFYLIDFYRVAFGRLPQYSEFVTDLASLVGTTAQQVFARRAAFANNFVQRPEFASIAALPNSSYVTTLMAGTNGQNYNLTSITTPDPANPDGATKVTLTTNDLINGLNANTLTKAQVLRAIVQSDQVVGVEAINAFVASQYYGYLRRTPEPAGFNAWVNYLTTHPTDFRTMVNGFMNSIEYRLRFGPT
jgi:hypothetical protein